MERKSSGKEKFMNVANLSRLIVDFHRKGIAVFFGCRIEADDLDSSRYIFALYQGGYRPEKELYTDRPDLIDGAYATSIVWRT
jgi:hypothetical protein